MEYWSVKEESSLCSVLPESYFVKRELRERPDPYASCELKRPRLGEGPQIHDIVSAGLKKLRATIKSGGSCVTPFNSLNLINSTQNNLHHSQSHDLQIILNKVSEIELKLESLRERKEREVDEEHHILLGGCKHKLPPRISTINQSADSNDLSKLPKPACTQIDEETNNQIEQLLNACLCISKNFGGASLQNEISHMQQLLLKIKNTIDNPSINSPKRKQVAAIEKKERAKREKRKLESPYEFEPMIEDHDEQMQGRRPKLTPRKLLFTFHPQNLMDIE